MKPFPSDILPSRAGPRAHSQSYPVAPVDPLQREWLKQLRLTSRQAELSQ